MHTLCWDTCGWHCAYITPPSAAAAAAAGAEFVCVFFMCACVCWLVRVLMGSCNSVEKTLIMEGALELFKRSEELLIGFSRFLRVDLRVRFSLSLMILSVSVGGLR
mgnify:CR=1 FL=1